MLKRIAKVVGCIAAVLILVVLVYLIFMTVTDYKPQEKLTLKVEYNKEENVKKGKSFSVITYNIGYCSLDKRQDFFMDGGTMSRSSSRDQTVKNMRAVAGFLKKEASDFILLQEVDVKSSRSYKVNEVDYLNKHLENYGNVFAINYKVPWVPVPLTHPMGSVLSGIEVFSRYHIDTATRYQYPGGEIWPRQLAELDRCFIESRLPVEGGKQLVLVNSHLSAYDKGGFVRKQQLGYLKKYIEEEYNKGNYVIVGGDWNHQLPGTDPRIFKTKEAWPAWCRKLPEGFTPAGFEWAADANVPTVRSIAAPYKEGVNFMVVIDGFLVSPNVEIVSVKGYNLKFANSDHNPVKAVFSLK